ncbi:MAG: hypothetical protein WC616_01605 [Candidatus Omnitrophota bacterium]
MSSKTTIADRANRLSVTVSRSRADMKINSAMLLGNPAALGEYNPVTGRMVVSDSAEPTSNNIILGPYRRIKAYFLSTLPELIVVPEGKTELLKRQAKIATEFLRAIGRGSELQKKYITLVDNILLSGIGGLKVSWNKKAGKYLEQDIYTGDISIQNRSILEMNIPDVTDANDMAWIADTKKLTADDIQRVYGIILPNKDADTLYTCTEYYSRPGCDRPEGSYVVTVDGKEHLNTVNPYVKSSLWSPYILFTFGISNLISIIPQSILTQTRGLQREYNKINAKIYGNIESFAGIKTMLPRGGKVISTAMDNSTNEVVEYDHMGGEPHQMMPVSMPSHVFMQLDRIKADLENFIGIHTVSWAKTKRTATEISQMAEEDSTNLAPDTTNFNNSLCNLGRLLLMLAKDGYKEVRTFAGGIKIDASELAEEITVDIQVGSGLPRSASTRREVVRQDFMSGVFDDNRPGSKKARELMKYNDTEDNFDDTLDTDFAIYENQQMMNGELCEIRDIDNHLIHLNTHHPVMKTVEFLGYTDEVKHMFYSHTGYHKDAIQQEVMQEAMQQQAAGMTGEQKNQQALGNPDAGGTPIG